MTNSAMTGVVRAFQSPSGVQIGYLYLPECGEVNGFQSPSGVQIG